MANVNDPVCGMQIDTADAAGQSDFQGRTYYFCSEDCKEKFDANPAQYTGDRGKTATQSNA